MPVLENKYFTHNILPHEKSQLLKAADEQEDVKLSDVLRSTVGLDAGDNVGAHDVGATQGTAAPDGDTETHSETSTEQEVPSSSSEEEPPSTYSPVPTPRGQEEVVYEYGGYHDVYAQYGDTHNEL